MALLLTVVLLVPLIHSAIAFIGPRSESSFRLPSKLFETTNQPGDVLKSLVNFHDGTWSGKATSFSVRDDVSAGIVRRKVSDEYKATVKIGLDLANTDFTLSETYEWGDEVANRKLSLTDAAVDVDEVDSSYSLDSALPDLPVDLIGDSKFIQFGIEHCIAASDDSRIRCFAFYGADQSLVRVVVCNEERIAEAVNPLSQFVEEKKKPEVLNANQLLSPRPMSLLELSTGVWTGDVVVRRPDSYEPGKGFSPPTRKKKKKFASWIFGVQKVAYRYAWDLDESIQKVVDVGKALGEPLAPEQSEPISGVVCVDESLSTKIPKDQRMCYFDWMGGNQVGFILGNVSIQLPRYLAFDGVETRRKCFTEVCVFQAEGDGDATIGATTAKSEPNVVCSMIGRSYDFNGDLKLAHTGFFEFNRMEQ